MCFSTLSVSNDAVTLSVLYIDDNTHFNASCLLRLLKSLKGRGRGRGGRTIVVAMGII